VTNVLNPTDETAETVDTSAKAVSVTFDEAEEQAWMEISIYLRAMNPYEFQDLVADLLRAMSYHVNWVSSSGKDGGVDILAWPDPLGTRPPRIKVQVKRQQQAVSVDGLRSFMAVLGDEDVGLFVSTGGFPRPPRLVDHAEEVLLTGWRVMPSSTIGADRGKANTQCGEK
jgi:restriction system protein